MTSFASPAVQPTPGTRGKTTRRRSTHTVRGNDGAYCAMMKEELLARPAWTAFQASVTVTYAESGIVNRVDLFRCTDREAVELWLAEYTARQSRYDRAGVTNEYAIAEVTVRWAWVNGDVREEVIG